MLRAAQERRIAGADAFAGPLEASDAIFGLASLPFVVQSIDAARAVNARARPLYEKALEARGLKLLYMTIWPSTGVWSDRPLSSADDLRTLAVRTYDNNSAEVMRAVGATVEYLPFNDGRFWDWAKINAKRGSSRPSWASIRQVGVTRSFLQESDEAASHLRVTGNDVPARMSQNQGIFEDARKPVGAAAWNYEIRLADDVSRGQTVI